VLTPVYDEKPTSFLLSRGGNHTHDIYHILVKQNGLVDTVGLLSVLAIHFLHIFTITLRDGAFFTVVFS